MDQILFLFHITPNLNVLAFALSKLYFEKEEYKKKLNFIWLQTFSYNKDQRV